MFDESEPSSPSTAIVAIAPLDPEWQPILHVSDQVVLYHATSHALSITTHSRLPSPAPSTVTRTMGERCPYCHRAMPAGLRAEHARSAGLDNGYLDDYEEHSPTRASNYFQLLEIANESSRPPTPPDASFPARTTPRSSHAGTPASSRSKSSTKTFRAENMAQGYFKAFFQEECRLGMGANGSVYLCQHVLDGNPLGYFAMKKIAVGQSHSYLVNILREVRLLEKLHHPNIITYHHAWLENAQFSSFGPHVPTLHVLMQWAEGGSLDDLIDTRLGRRAPAHLPHLQPSTPDISTPSPTGSPAPDASAPYSRAARIRAFRAYQRASLAERERLRSELGLDAVGVPRSGPNLKAVHLFSAEEVKSLFTDITSGLAFLHEKSVLHLDLKPGNVLLTWDEGHLIPRAMLSDFGTSQDMLNSRPRSGNTGTLEYSSPESLPAPSTGLLRQVDSKADMWSLGMILHKLLFFRLPYANASGMTGPARDGKETADLLEREVANYPGFKSNSALSKTFESRRLPRAYLVLLEGLLNVTTSARPSAERVLSAIREGRLDPLAPSSSQDCVVSVPRRPAHEDDSVPANISEYEPPSPSTDSVAIHDEWERSPALTNEKDGARFPPLPPAGIVHVWSLNVYGRQVNVRLPRVVWVRTLKSGVLVLKVLSLPTFCPDIRFHPVIVSTVLALAVVDTWFDSLEAVVIFGVLHAVLVSLACWLGRF